MIVPPFVPGALYKLHSRNLKLGVYAGGGAFIGIREKFGDRYLFAEYWAGEAGGTVTSAEPLERAPVPPEIRLSVDAEDFTRCDNCGKIVEWSGPPAPAPWIHKEETSCEDPLPFRAENKQLFLLLEAVENE